MYVMLIYVMTYENRQNFLKVNISIEITYILPCIHIKSDCYLLQIFIFEMLQQIGLWVRKFLSIVIDFNRTVSKFSSPVLLKFVL